MGREIRRVPPNWQHPTHLVKRFVPRLGYRLQREYKSMLDETHAEALAEWEVEKAKWDAGERPDYFEPDDTSTFDEWHGPRPEPQDYRPYSLAEATWFQLWQTVSEGYPVSPPFATLDELAAYLAEYGDEWDQDRKLEAMHPVAAQVDDGPIKAGWGKERAEAFCRSGWAPSMVVTGGKVLGNAGEIALEAAKAKKPSPTPSGIAGDLPGDAGRS